MYVQNIALASWRNIASADVDFGEGINVLWGMNAQGKSNILESIYYFARGRSFRGAKDRELIRFGDDFASAAITFRHDGYENDTSLDCVIPQTSKKRLRKNSSPLASAAEMMGVFRAVLFCPKDLSVVTGGPAERRTFLDVALSQLSGTYLTYLRRYTKALAERNALLKRAADGNYVSSDEWEVYAEVMASSAAVVCAYRNDYVNMLSAEVEKYFSEMTSGGEKPSLRYTSHALYDGMPAVLSAVPSEIGNAQPTEILRDKLLSNIEREKAAGSTLWGIHKDDILLSVNGMEAKLYASQGQQRSFALAFKLGEAEIANLLGGEYPVILLDDVFSELDESRRRYILEILSENAAQDEKKSNRQIIITSCEPDIIPHEKLSHVTFRNVKNGGIVG
ncbi:MAG: DNA replication/repair protein RecF [Eubacteriales bacterium]